MKLALYVHHEAGNVKVAAAAAAAAAAIDASFYFF